MANVQGEGSIKGLPQQATTIRRFIELLEAADILPAVDMAAIKQQLPEAKRDQDAAEIARKLVAQHALTKHQAASLYQQKPKNLGLGSYIFLDRLGTGGSGSVFKAKHRKSGDIVAVKVLNLTGARSPDALKRFQREAETAARLKHPNIVRALETGEAGGQYFTAMEYVEGTDLSTYVKKSGPLPWAQAAQCVVTAGRALAYAHEQGIIHRDIKPANLMLCNDGTIKVLDMGLARLQDPAAEGNNQAAEGLTQTGQVMGTVDYMAPEQALHTRLADARADVYSLGCTLYRLVTGDIPFDGDSMVAKILSHRETPIPSMKAKNPKVPSTADTCLQKMLAKKPEDRYQSMTELADELERCTQGYDIAPLTPPSKLPSAVSSPEADSRSNNSLTINTSASTTGMPSGVTKKAEGEKPQPRRKTPVWVPIAAGIVAVAAVGGIAWVSNQGNLASNEPEIVQAIRPTEATATADPIASATPSATMPTPLPSSTATAPIGLASATKPTISIQSGNNGPSTGVTTPTDDRSVALYAISKGYQLVVYDQAAGQTREAKTPADVPQSMTVMALLATSPNLSVDDFLTRIAAARHLSGLSFKGAVVPPGSLTALTQYPKLQTVIFNDSTLDDAQLKAVESIGTLRQLELARTRATTAALDTIARLTGLLHLNLAGMPVNDGDLTKLAGLSGLQTLNLENAPLTDGAVAVLSNFKNLQSLTIRGTQITSAGRGQLAAALPSCKIDLPPGPTTLALSLPSGSPAPVAVASGTAQSGNAAPTVAPGYAGEREFAQWCFSQGFRVAVFIPTAPTFSQSVNTFNEMPPGDFAVTTVYLQGNNPLNKAIFDKLATAPFLGGLYCYTTTMPVEPGAWQHLARLSKLHMFAARNFDDADAAVLRSLPELRFLDLANSRITDAAFDAVSSLPNLAYLNLNGVKTISEAGIGKLASCPLLKRLNFNSTSLSDSAITALSTLSHAQSINLTSTQLTQDGRARLAAALPGCDVYSSSWYGYSAPRPTADAIAAANRATVPGAMPNATAIATGLVNTGAPIPGATPSGTAAVSFEQKKLPVPTEDKLASSLKLIREELFKDKYAAAKKPEERVTLATELLGQAKNLGDDTNGAYAMLREARDMAADGGDIALAFSACGNAESQFELDALEWLAEACEAAAKKTQARNVSRSMAEGLAFKVEDAVAAQKYETADRLLTTALAAARKSLDPNLTKQLVDREKQVTVLKKQFDEVVAARKTLAEKADDPAANLVVGKYACFVEGKWDEGLPLLAKSSDATFKALAEKSAGKTSAEWLAAGDQWWTQGEKAPKTAQKDFLLAALYFYEKSAPDQSGLQRTRIDKRIADARTVLGDAAPKVGGTPFAAGGVNPPVGVPAPPPQAAGADATRAFVQWTFARNGFIHARYPLGTSTTSFSTRYVYRESDFATITGPYTVVGATFEVGRGAVISDADARYLASLTWVLELSFIGQQISNSTASTLSGMVGSSRVDLQACKLEYSIVSPK